MVEIVVMNLEFFLVLYSKQSEKKTNEESCIILLSPFFDVHKQCTFKTLIAEIYCVLACLSR